jgi:hypothetical protein
MGTSPATVVNEVSMIGRNRLLPALIKASNKGVPSRIRRVIKSTNTILVVGQVQHLFIPDHAMDELGQINLSLVDDVGISGLNSYYQLQKLAEFPYARVSELPDFKS